MAKLEARAYSRRIHGKEVDVVLHYGKSAFSEAGAMLKELLGKDEKVSASTFDRDFFLDVCLGSIFETLDRLPEFITYSPFCVAVKITEGQALNEIASYNSFLSSSACAVLEVRAGAIEQYVMKSIRQGDDALAVRRMLKAYLDIAIQHELRHHTEHFLFAARHDALKFFSDKHQSHQLITVYFLASLVRLEAVTTFEQKASMRDFSFNLSSIKALGQFLQSPTKDPMKLHALLMNAAVYNMGVYMAVVIFANEYRREFPQAAKQINEYIAYLKNALSTGKESVGTPAWSNNQVFYAIKLLTGMSLQEFFKAFEKACVQLSIPAAYRFLTWSNYKKYMKTAYGQYMEDVRSNNLESKELFEIMNVMLAQLLKEDKD